MSSVNDLKPQFLPGWDEIVAPLKDVQEKYPGGIHRTTFPPGTEEFVEAWFTTCAYMQGHGAYIDVLDNLYEQTPHLKGRQRYMHDRFWTKQELNLELAPYFYAPLHRTGDGEFQVPLIDIAAPNIFKGTLPYVKAERDFIYTMQEIANKPHYSDDMMEEILHNLFDERIAIRERFNSEFKLNF